MNDKIIVSKDNVVSILTVFFQGLNTKIKNKDISLPYKTQLSKSDCIKINGEGNMFLNNNGHYIDLGNIEDAALDVEKIYSIFNIKYIEKWENVDYIISTPIQRKDHRMVAYNGKIYCIGGFGTNLVSIYNISSNTWSYGQNMPIVRHEFGCIEYNNKIYQWN